MIETPILVLVVVLAIAAIVWWLYRLLREIEAGDDAEPSRNQESEKPSMLSVRGL
jgi:hypothetical protein